MKIQDLSPPVAVPEPVWKQQLVEFWQQANDHHRIDLEVTLKMGDVAGAQRIIESWQQEMIEQQKKKSRPAKKNKSRVRYGYGGYWTPGFNFGGTELGSGDGGGGESVQEASTPDGVSASTKMFLEQDTASVSSVIQDFVSYCVDQLGISQAPRLQLRRDPAWSERNRSFGSFDPETNRLDISVADRHVMDVLRTVAHELVHHHQQEQQDLPPDAGEAGSEYENQANARAGELMRGYGRDHPELFGGDTVSESSGYIPTAAQKNDPRFKMALSPDVRPGATGKNANRMGLKTGAQGEPTLLIKGLRNALREFKESGSLSLTQDQDLFEIKMTDSNLKKLVQGIDARAGMEFEMYVPGVNTGDEDEFESEPDMDQDERVDSISDARQFFYDGDFNGRRDVDNLAESMTEDYQNWLQEQLDEKWQQEGQDFLRDYIDRNGLFDRDEYTGEAQQYVREQFADLAGIDETSEAFLDAVTERLDDIADEFAADAMENQDNGYDAALEEFNNEHADDYEDSQWLRSEGYRYMSDVLNNYSIEWPHWTTSDGGNGDGSDIDQVADDFSRAIGRPVNASTRYHGGRREPGHYVIEPDGSLDEPRDSDDSGLEFISPPLPLDELISDLDKIRAWAKSRGCYTQPANQQGRGGTGLHMNVSVPDTSTAKLDYVKLALLLGDERVLAEFGRSANTYTKSALGKIRDLLKEKPEAVQQVMAKMREHMEALATKVIHTGDTDKFTSINTKDNYVEFRSPGGDYLDENWDKVKPTLLRTVVALDAAMNPEKYRQEYQKKLYKLLDNAKETAASPQVNQLLSMYLSADQDSEVRSTAVKLAQELLTKREMSRKELERQQELRKQVGSQPGQKFWWNVQVPDRDPVNVVGADEADALEQASAMANRSVAYVKANGTVNIVKPYVPTADTVANGAWGVSLSGSSRFERQRNNPDEIMTWATKEDAETWIDNRAMNNPRGYSTYVAREVSAGALTGAWGIWAADVGRFVTSDGEIRRFASAEDVQAWIASYQQSGAHRDVRLEPRDIASEELPDIFPDIPQQPAAAAQQAYEIFDRPSGAALEQFQAADGQAAVRFLRDYQSQGPHRLSPAEAGQQFGVRLNRGGTAPRTLTTPGQPQQTFSGEWKIVDSNGQELHRFGGVGNVQADANATAVRWLRQNPRHMQAGVEVVPVMSE